MLNSVALSVNQKNTKRLLRQSRTLMKSSRERSVKPQKQNNKKALAVTPYLLATNFLGKINFGCQHLLDFFLPQKIHAEKMFICIFKYFVLKTGFLMASRLFLLQFWNKTRMSQLNYEIKIWMLYTRWNTLPRVNFLPNVNDKSMKIKSHSKE